MQTREYVGPFVDRNPDLGELAWGGFGSSFSHVDGSDLTGLYSGDTTGGAAAAHAMTYDDGLVPSLATIRLLTVKYRLGNDALSSQGALPVVPYMRYEGGPPVSHELLSPPYTVGFADFTADFPRDPDGLPWTRASIFGKRGHLLLFGLRTGISGLLTAQIKWTECRFIVTFDLPVPLVSTDPASLIGASQARINGRVNPRSANGAYPLTYWFEWGTTTSYGNQTTPVANVTGNIDLSVYSDLSGLVVGGGYHFRLVVQTLDGIVYGSDSFFTTDPTATGRFRLDEFKRLPTGQFLPSDRTRLTSVGFDRASTSTDDSTCPFLSFP